MHRVNKHWLALMMGNSRLHWAWFVGNTLQQAWDTNHLPAATVELLIQRWVSGILPEDILPPLLVSQASDSSHQLPLYLASVTPDRAKLWQAYPATTVITLEQVPLLRLYPTLGIDRALAVFGAGETLSYPVLVIDAGTALTFTGADTHRQLVGGAILPGLKLQLQSLAKNTAALPEIQLPTQLPQRWALQTSGAIESGVIYTVLAGIRDFVEDWQAQFPESPIVLTGGDSQVLFAYLQTQFPQHIQPFLVDPYLIFWGMRSLRGMGE